MGRWIESTVENLCSLAYGKNLPQSSFTESGYFVYGANGMIGYSEKYTHRDITVLVSCRGEYSGKINLSSPCSYITNNSIPLNIRNTNSMNTMFLYYTMQLIPRSSMVSGSAQPQVVINDLKKVNLYYPESLDEQRRIAEILSTIDEAIDSTQALIDKHEQIKEGMMHDLFTRGVDPVTGSLRPHPSIAPELYQDSELGLIPKEWEVDSIGSFGSLIYGKGLNEKKYTDEGGTLVLGTGGVVGLTHEYLYNRETIIIGRKGTINNKIYIESGVKIWVIDTAYYFKSYTNIIIKWLYYKLLKINLMNYSEATGVPSLSRDLFHSIKLTFPIDPKEQMIIVDKISGVESMLESYKSKKQKLLLQKQGLMQDLLSGKVKVM